MANVGIYARISADRDGTALGVERQLNDCRRLAQNRGWTVGAEYVDNDVSAYAGKPRPEYQRMIADLEHGRIDGVVVYNTDRLYRQPRDLEDFIDLTQRLRISRNLATVSGDIDLSTSDGQFVARLLGASARKESDDKSRRLKRKHQELAERGQVSGGGTRPFGYDDDRTTVRASEARLIREAAERVLSGEPIRAIATDWNERGVTTSTGGLWTATSLRRVLHSARISGRREHKGQIVADATWPAIIPPERSDALRAVLDAPHRRTSHSARRYVLAGLLRCHHCGATMVSRPREDGRRRYVCAKRPEGGCNKTMIVADELELLVAEGVMHRLDTPELDHALRSQHTATDAADLNDLIARDQAMLDQLTDAFTNAEITMHEWKRARTTIEERLRENRRRLARQSDFAAIADWVGNGQLLRDQWADLDLHRQRAIISAVVDHLVIGPGRRGFNRFDHTRVMPIWRDAQADQERAQH